MKSRRTLLCLTLTLLIAPGSMTAQTVAAEITVKVPVNLTQLSPEIPKIQVSCAITSDPITSSANHSVTKNQEIPVSGAQVVTTATLVFSFTGLDNPVGKNGNIGCWVMGWSTKNGWTDFSPTATDPLFKVSAQMASTTPFVW